MITVPTLPVDGTDRDKLITSYADAARALTVLKHKLLTCEPLAKDYAPAAYRHARVEHLCRIEMVNAIGRELTDIVRGLLEQIL